MAREVVIYCDESLSKGRHFSNFYGGALVPSASFDHVRASLAAKKSELGFTGEVKWQKVSWGWEDKYIALVDMLFDLVEQGHVKIRVMFTQNIRVARGLTDEQIENEYFILYYMFIKHAFGLEHCNPVPMVDDVHVRIYLDQIPDNIDKAKRFKEYLATLTNSVQFKKCRVRVLSHNIADVCSHDHDILQCLDIVLGSMQFRLNDLHLEIPKGQRNRGKRTRAKEKVYKHINKRLQRLRPYFNIGASTGDDGDTANRWAHPYRHWLFVPTEHEVDTSRSKRSRKK